MHVLNCNVRIHVCEVDLARHIHHACGSVVAWLCLCVYVRISVCVHLLCVHHILGRRVASTLHHTHMSMIATSPCSIEPNSCEGMHLNRHMYMRCSPPQVHARLASIYLCSEGIIMWQYREGGEASGSVAVSLLVQAGARDALATGLQHTHAPQGH